MLLTQYIYQRRQHHLPLPACILSTAEIRSCLLMVSISNLTLYGNDVSEVKVICRGENSGGLSFYNVTNLTIRDVSFWNCSKRQHWSLDSLEVHIEQAFNVIIEHINIQHTPGLGLSLKNVFGNNSINNITVDNSHSTHKSKASILHTTVIIAKRKIYLY